MRKLTLLEAVRELYYSAIWHADRPVNEQRLWTQVRDAAGFEPGNSPKTIASPLPTGTFFWADKDNPLFGWICTWEDVDGARIAKPIEYTNTPRKG